MFREIPLVRHAIEQTPRSLKGHGAPSPRLEEEDAETRGQNDDALARRLELADARADEGGNIAFRRVLLNARWGSAAAGRLRAARSCSLRARAAMRSLRARAAIFLLSG